MGASVHCVSLDVSDEAAVRSFLDGYVADGWPPVRGVVHLAALLDRRLIGETTTADFEAAYTQSLLWYITGDETYAQAAIAILNGWSAVLKNHTGSNGPLQAAWSVPPRTDFARRLARTALLSVLGRPVFFTPFARALENRGHDLDEVLHAFTRGFPGPDFLQRLRRAPGGPLLSLLDAPETLVTVNPSPECFEFFVVGASAGRSQFCFGGTNSVTKAVQVP